jgi:hypothetical protein
VTGLTLWKYALALLGIAIIFFGERTGRPLFGYIGLGFVLAAFFLRFVRRPRGPEDAG